MRNSRRCSSAGPRSLLGYTGRSSGSAATPWEKTCTSRRKVSSPPTASQKLDCSVVVSMLASRVPGPVPAVAPPARSPPPPSCPSPSPAQLPALDPTPSAEPSPSADLVARLAGGEARQEFVVARETRAAGLVGGLNAAQIAAEIHDRCAPLAG